MVSWFDYALQDVAHQHGAEMSGSIVAKHEHAQPVNIILSEPCSTFERFESRSQRLH